MRQTQAAPSVHMAFTAVYRQAPAGVQRALVSAPTCWQQLCGHEHSSGSSVVAVLPSTQCSGSSVGAVLPSTQLTSDWSTHPLLGLLLLAKTASRPWQHAAVAPYKAHAALADCTAALEQLTCGLEGRSLMLYAAMPAGSKYIGCGQLRCWSKVFCNCCAAEHVLAPSEVS
jgi:hypothetical protein